MLETIEKLWAKLLDFLIARFDKVNEEIVAGNGMAVIRRFLTAALIIVVAAALLDVIIQDRFGVRSLIVRWFRKAFAQLRGDDEAYEEEYEDEGSDEALPYEDEYEPYDADTEEPAAHQEPADDGPISGDTQVIPPVRAETPAGTDGQDVPDGNGGGNP